MTHSESLAHLAPALVAAQKDLDHAHKNSTNPHFKNKYANLAEVIDCSKDTLAKHGLAVMQIPGFEAGVVTLHTMLVHTSGEWVMGVSGSPAPKQDPQGVGSAVTYLRRYSLAALCNITQDDDDGEGAVGRGAQQQRAPEPAFGERMPTVTEKPASAAARATLHNWLAALKPHTKNMLPAEKTKVTKAEAAVTDPAATDAYVEKARKAMQELLEKYVPLDPFKSEERVQNMELEFAEAQR